MMSLFNKIALVLSVFLLALLVTVMFLNFKTANSFVQDQLYTDAQNTANSLGLSLSTAVDGEDVATMETMINAVFDSGYYQDILLKDIDGKTLVNRHQEVEIVDIPSWFVSSIRLDTPMAEAPISSGWMPFGSIHVRSHSGHAYIQLWESLVQIGSTFVGLSVGALALLYVLLKLILQPLAQVQRQAEAINENQFIIVKNIPGTKEIRHVVLAMNGMVSKVKTIFEKEAEAVKQYNELLYKDGPTKLHNRRYFMRELGDYLGPDSVKASGSIAMLSLNDIGKANEQLGFKKMDELLLEIANLLKKEIAALTDDGVAARLSGTDFALLVPGAELVGAEQLTQSIISGIKTLFSQFELDENEFFFSVGIAPYTPFDNIKTVLTKTDHALTQAKLSSSFSSRTYHEDGNTMLMGKEEWKEEIYAALDEGRIKLAAQSTVCYQDNGENIFHDEVYVRLEDRGGSIHPAGYFMPMVVTLNLASVIDKHVIELALSIVSSGKSDNTIAINMSPEMIQGSSIISWIENQLSELNKAQRSFQLSFEITNKSAIRFPDACARFSSIVRRYSCKFGIDNFSADSDNFSYLQSIRPNYIKIDRRYIMELTSDSQAKSAYDSIHNIASSLGIQVISTSVEDEEQMNKLKEMGIHCFQGRYVSDISLLELEVK